MPAAISGPTFEAMMPELARRCGWRLADVGPNRAHLPLSIDAGEDVVIEIIRYDSKLEFRMVTAYTPGRIQFIASVLLALLLSRNASEDHHIGFWCIPDGDGGEPLTFMHNADVNHLDAKYFEEIIRAFVNDSLLLDEFVHKLGGGR